MRNARPLAVLAASLLARSSIPAQTGQAAGPLGARPPASRPASHAGADERVWDGYVFTGRDGKLEVGWPVVAMGVEVTAPHVVVGDLAARLKPLACPIDDNWLFVNYTLEQEKAALDKLPRWLVTLRGRVAGDDEDEMRMSSMGRPQTMVDARLVAVEPVPQAWYREWALFFRDPRSPFRVAREPEKDKDALAAFAVDALAALNRMRAVPGPDAAEVARLRAIEPGVAIVEKYRRRHETAIQRWLVEDGRKHGWKLDGLDALGPLPPASTEIQGWFLGSKSRAAFLARVADAWKGEADHLVLVHYVTRGNSTSWTETELWQVRDRWTDAEYERNQKSTRETLGGR